MSEKERDSIESYRLSVPTGERIDRRGGELGRIGREARGEMDIVDRHAQESREERTLAPYGMRSARSRGRRYPEEEHSLRTRYQRDRDRVVHCSSFRRLE